MSIEITNETAVALTPSGQVYVPLDGQLSNVDQAWRMAQIFATADIVPDALKRKPANVFLVILYGLRLGLPPEVAISEVSVVKGKPRMSGQLLLSKIREAKHRPFVPCKQCGRSKGEHTMGNLEHSYVADRSPQHCTFTIVRSDGEEHTETFTLDDAVTAGLCRIKDGKPYARSKQGEPLPWENYPQRMLLWRAVSNCTDVICPEVKMGFAVEGEFEAPAQEHPTLAQVAAERMDQQPAEEPAEPEKTEEEVQQAEILADLAEIEAEHAAEGTLWAGEMSGGDGE